MRHSDELVNEHSLIQKEDIYFIDVLFGSIDFEDFSGNDGLRPYHLKTLINAEQASHHQIDSLPAYKGYWRQFLLNAQGKLFLKKIFYFDGSITDSDENLEGDFFLKFSDNKFPNKLLIYIPFNKGQIVEKKESWIIHDLRSPEKIQDELLKAFEKEYLKKK